MKPRRRSRAAEGILLAASLVSVCGLALPVGAQEGAPGATPGGGEGQTAQAAPSAAPDAPEQAPAQPASAQPAAAQPAPAQPSKEQQTPPAAQAPAEGAAPAPAAQAGPGPQAPARDARIRFNFKDAPIDQVIDFFARESGVPVIREAAQAPAGALTFISAEAYPFEEALSILNLNLAAYGVGLRKEGQYLYLSSLQDVMRKPTDVASGAVPEGLPPDRIVTLTIPLNTAKADIVATQVAPLAGPFGKVTAVPQQNLLVIVETAAQCRRLLSIVKAIDVAEVDSAFRLFPLKFAQADTVVKALTGLMGERVRQVFIDKDGRQTVAQETTVAGLNLQPDPRTNSVIAVGAETRIKKVEELIALLDVPEAGQADQEMMTFALAAAAAPADVATQVGALFQNVPANRKPTLIPLPESQKITVVGPAALVAQAAVLIGEIDPGAAKTGGGQGSGYEQVGKVIRLTHAAPAAVEQTVTRLLTARQAKVVKIAQAPDGKNVIVAGPAGEVVAVEALIAGLDAPGDVPREVRQARIAAKDPRATLDKAIALYKATGRDVAEPVTATLDGESRTATLIGSRAGVDRFAELLRGTEASMVVDQETRTFDLTKARASVLAGQAARLARPMLTPADGSAYHEPSFEPLDEFGKIVVRAEPSQFAVIEELVKRLDQEEGAAGRFQVIKVTGGDPRALADRALKLYGEQTAGMRADQAGPVSVEVDAASGSLLVTGRPQAVQVFSSVLAQMQQLAPPTRTTHIVNIQNVQAKDIVAPLNEFLASADSIDPARQVPAPTVRVVERTNSLLVTAEEAQHRLVADYIARLDRIDQTGLPPLKLLQLRAADVTAVAAMLNEQYAKRPQTERAAKPVEVRADAATSTLIVSAHPDLFEEIKSLVADLNKEKGDAEQRVTQLFPLKVAKATDVAAALDKLYPLPPVPVDRLNRPMPWLQKPKEVTVSAEQSSNSLIIDAPAERMESIRTLAEKLDRVEMPPSAELRTFHIVGADLTAVARTLNALAGRGNLSAPAQPGKPQVQVVIDSEPKSSTLIVAGDATTFERVEQVLKDLSAVPVEKGLRVVPVVGTPAGPVRDRAMKIYEAQVAQIPGANPVEVTVDQGSNSLMVVADHEAMDRFMKVIDELQRQAGPAREVRLMEMRYAKAEKVKGFLDDLVKSSETFRVKGGADPVFEVIEATNSLMVAAQPAQFAIIDVLVKSLDNEQATERPPMRILRLRATDAANLASVLQQSYDRRATDVRAKRPVDIQADAATNTLIVSAHPEVLPEIEQIVTELNQTQALDEAGREIRIFPLRVARAEDLAKTIDQMYPEPPIPVDPRTRQPMPERKQPKEVVVRADRATNSLIVDAPGKRLAGFEQLVKSLDQTKLAENVELRTYRVKRADLNAAATAIRSAAASGALYAGGEAGSATPVTVDVEPASKSLIVSGPADVFKGVEKVLAQVDAAPERPATGVKMYALTQARAERLQPVLQKVLQGRLRDEQQASGKTYDDAATLVDVVADAGANALIVTAPESILSTADGLVKTLDQQSGATSVEMRVFRLAKGDSASAATAIKASLGADLKTGETAPTVTPEPASNTIVVVGTAAQIERAAKLVESLDVAVDKEGVGVRSIVLRHARAEAMAPVLEGVFKRDSLMDKLPEWQRAQYLAQRGGAEPRPVRVLADKRLNAVVVSGPVSVLDMAEQIAATLDVEPGEASGGRAVRIITLTNADATELSTSMTAVFAEEQGGKEPPTIRVDKASNSLIVRADAEQMATVESLASKLDSATLGTSRQMRMIPVDRSKADAAMMAQTLKRLLEQQGGGGVQVEVINAADLLKKNEEPKPEKPRGMIETPMRGVPAGPTDWRTAMAAVVVSLSVAQVDAAPQAGAAGPGPQAPARQAESQDAPGGSPVTIAVDPATNSLVVLGSPRMTDRLAALVAELEKQMPSEPTKVRIIGLPDAVDPAAVAAVVNQTVAQVGRGSAQNPGGFTGPVAVSADPGGGALIVWANDTDFESIGKVIGAVSRLDAGTDLTVKVYPLSSVTAPRAMQAINDLLSPRPRGQQARRIRGAVDLTLEPGAPGVEEVKGRIDPSTVRMTADPGGTALIVAAPAEALPVIDRFVAMIDISPVTDRMAIRRYTLKNAQAATLGPTMQQLLEAQRQGPQASEFPQARFVADERTNTLLVTASEAQHRDVLRLLEAMDTEEQDKDLTLAVIPLQNATPTSVKQIVEQVVVGDDPAKKKRVQVSAQDQSNLLVVRAPAEQIAEIKGIVAQVDTGEVAGLPVRSIKLERADARQTAQVLTQFFQNRAQVSSRPGAAARNRVAVVGDSRSSTLIVTASDDDFAQIKDIVATIDQKALPRDMAMRVVALQNARVTELQDTVQEIQWQLQYERANQYRGGMEPQGGGRVFAQANQRTNSYILVGEPDALETMEKLIRSMDIPQPAAAKLAVKAVSVKTAADLDAIARVVRRAMQGDNQQQYRWWMSDDNQPDSVRVEADEKRRAVILVGPKDKVEQAAAYVEELATAGGKTEQQTETFTLRHAQADRVANSLRQVLRSRAESQGLPVDSFSIIGSRDGNVLFVTAEPAQMASLRDLVAQVDQPELGKDRRREVVALKNRAPDEVAAALRAQFPRERAEAAVLVTAQPSLNSLIISAPADDFEQVGALIAQLDAVPAPETAKVMPVTLKTARAQDVADALGKALPQGLNLKVTPVPKNNTLLLTGSDDAIRLAMDNIAKIDVEAERPLVEFKRVVLKNGTAIDVAYTLRQMMRGRPRGQGEPEPGIDYSTTDNTISISASAEQMRDITKMIEALDVPTGPDRTMEFVKLEHARAEQVAKALEVFYGPYAVGAKTPGARRVTIVPDPASNSLLVMADANEWEGVRGLLKKLDSEEYDTSRQLVVIPLEHADATSVAKALNEGFRAPVEDQIRREQIRTERERRGRGDNGRGREQDFPETPTVLVDTAGMPTVSAETQTNSLVVFAGREDLDRIRAIVKQLDVAEFAKLPDVHVLPLRTAGKASQIAASIRAVFTGQPQRQGGPKAVVIAGDDASGSLIVRADEAEFAQIKALAESMQQQGDLSRATVRVLTLKNIPAARIQKTLLTTFTPSAQQLGEPLAVEIDRASNALVVSSSERLFKEIERVAAELDGRLPAGVGPDGKPVEGQGPAGLGQTIFIIDVKNNSPEEVRKLLEQMGLTKDQPVDRQGVVSEPVTIVPLTTRSAIAVVASPKDGEAVVRVVRALDADPASPDQRVEVIGLKLASAETIVATLKEMVSPEQQAAGTPPAKALAEQVRRLSIARNGIEQGDLTLDLGKPVRLIADKQTNSVVIGSTAENVAALREIVRTLDSLPMGDAVVVRMFPLQNAAAMRLKTVVDELFKQGEALRRLPGTQRQGLPTTMTGRALAGEVAVSVDDRTNTLIVAGREEAVAFVEVLVKDLDSAEASKWVEPALVKLDHADAVKLSATLKGALVQGAAGAAATPEMQALQRQSARLRMAIDSKEGVKPGAVESDIYVPLTGLVISADEPTNSLIVVGTPANIAVVREMAKMLDVELASAANTVRVFPLQRAAADRIAGIVSGLFHQREQEPSARAEDRVYIAPDARTNALIVSTSPRSFSILEALLKTLDTEKADYTVGLHVIPVVGADAAALAPKIQQLMQDRIRAAQAEGAVRSPLDTFSVTPDVANNLLIVACSDENLQLVTELVDAVAKGNPAMASAQRTELIPLRKGRAADMAETLKSLYVDKENAKRGAGSVSVLPNERLNALVVSGTEGDVTRVRAEVERLESADVVASQDIRMIELRSANALEMTNLVENILAGRPVGGRGVGGRQATTLRLFREQIAHGIEEKLGAKPTEAQIDGAIREQVTLTPDLRTNTIIVNAPSEVMPLVREIIVSLDTSKRDRRIETYELKNADARQMAELLRDVFNLRQQGSLYVLVPTEQPTPEQGTEIAPSVGGTKVTPVPDERQQLSIAIDARTNTLIVSGTDEYLELVAKLVHEIDAKEAQERARSVYHLKNAKASEIQKSLQDYFHGETELLRSTLSPDQAGSLARLLEQEVTIVGDEKSNRLVISTSPRYMEVVTGIVKELDSAPPQVTIQVILAEVTHDNSDDWGMDIKVGNIGGDNFTMGALAAGAGVTTALGVPNLTVASADLTLLIRALEAQGKLQVLSRPEVTANNNETASINVGQNVAIVQSVERLENGNERANVDRRDVGIILNVTPSISPDGFVRMEIEPEISTVSQKTTQITATFDAPIINTRKVDTTVTVKDGETVVIGGLIQSTKEARRTKVPILGDIPFFGLPFRSVQDTDVKTELLVILTPRVIFNSTEDDIKKMRDASERAIERFSAGDDIRELLRGDTARHQPAPDPALSDEGPYQPGSEPDDRSDAPAPSGSSK